MCGDGHTGRRENSPGGTLGARGPVLLGSLDDRGDRAQDLPRRRVPEVEVHEPGEPIAQIAVQGGLHQGQQPARGTNHELVKRLTPVGSK